MLNDPLNVTGEKNGQSLNLARAVPVAAKQELDRVWRF